MIDAQSLAAVKAGLSPGGARSPLVPLHRGRALANLLGFSPDTSVLTNHPLYCGEVFGFAKKQILPNKPILKIHNTMPANGIPKTLRLSAHKTNPIHSLKWWPLADGAAIASRLAASKLQAKTGLPLEALAKWGQTVIAVHCHLLPAIASLTPNKTGGAICAQMRLKTASLSKVMQGVFPQKNSVFFTSHFLKILGKSRKNCQKNRSKIRWF